MSGPPEEDDELIRRAATEGDRVAFAALFERHGRAVLSATRALSPDLASAEDAAQETFASALRSINTYQPGISTARSWLLAIARNAARRSRRHDREIPTDDQSLLDLGVAAGWGGGSNGEGGEDPEGSLGRMEDTDRLARAIASLSPGDREVIELRDVEQFSGEETAELLGLSLASMKSRLHRARLKLMVLLRETEGGVVTNERDVGGISCGAVLERLGDYVDGELSREDVAKVDAHLKQCTICERFGGRYARVVHAARERLGAPHALDVDDEALQRLRAALA